MRALLAGQRGVGKTTELCRLASDLSKGGRQALMCDVGGTYSFVGQIVEILAEKIETAYSMSDDTGVEWARFLKAVSWVKTSYGSPLVLLIDGMERGADNAVDGLMKALENCGCSAILVASLPAMLAFDFNHRFEVWDPVLLPAFSILKPDRTADPAGRKSLENVLERRIGTGLIVEAALDLLLTASGGICRELVGLAGYACLVAHQRKNPLVTVDDATAAVRQWRLKYTPGLKQEDLDALKAFGNGHRDLVDPALFEQVNYTRIVAYHGDKGLWWDVHPILWPLVGII